MTTPGKPDLTSTIARLRERFLASSEQTIATFGSLAERLAGEPADVDAIETLQRELHRTHGTAGSYGFHAASRAAAALEAVAAQWLAAPALDPARRGAIVRRFAEALDRAFTGDGSASRRILLVDVGDESFVALVSEALHRGVTAERVAAAALAGVLAERAGTVVGIVAGPDASVGEAGGTAVVRLAPGDDAAAAIRSLCGQTP